MSVHVGQCGNQIGQEFWTDLLSEFASSHIPGTVPVYSPAMARSFHNFDKKTGEMREPGSAVSHIVARAVLVDMEERVVDRLTRSKIGRIFNANLTDCSGSGNNWAVGHRVMGEKHGDEILDLIRREMESCDACDAIMWSLSTGGGTGSGLGSFLLERVADEYQNISRIVTVVFPSGPDDVVTSPYNSILATARLAEFATVVLPVDNTALARANIQQQSVNGVISTLWRTITASTRYGAAQTSLSEELGKISTGRRKFLIPSVSAMKPGLVAARSFDNMLADATKSSQQLLSVDTKKSSMSGACVMAVYDSKIATNADVERNVIRLESMMRFKPVRVVPVATPFAQGALALLSNSSATHQLFDRTIQKFEKLFKRRANLHHYSSLVEMDEFITAKESLKVLSRNYSSLSCSLVVCPL